MSFSLSRHIKFFSCSSSSPSLLLSFLFRERSLQWHHHRQKKIPRASLSKKERAWYAFENRLVSCEEFSLNLFLCLFFFSIATPSSYMAIFMYGYSHKEETQVVLWYTVQFYTHQFLQLMGSTVIYIMEKAENEMLQPFFVPSAAPLLIQYYILLWKVTRNNMWLSGTTCTCVR